ncbi:MAG: [acyl-carrier-protein] S-malonyltransferase [Pedosphaera sp.]|nr:[acyl-carrier-protein] S-malonyltransferase [Pedosphaera sp.]
MTKTALLFAGQGAQGVGMGRDLAETYPIARTLFDQANGVLGCDLAVICFSGPEAALTRTENAQPAIYLISWVALALLQHRVPAFSFQAAAGLSLGEFTALAAAGALSFEDGLQIVRQRGRFMHEACEATQGGMAAIIGLDESSTREVCLATGVTLANLNCPGQIVISGAADRISAAVELAKTRGARKAIPLTVAGAYHSPLMASAQPKLATALAGVPLLQPCVPVIANVTGKPHGTPAEIAHLLIDQVTSPVRWEDSIRHLLADGFNRFIELGPGTALSGFMKRIDKSVPVFNVADIPSLEATVFALHPSS